MTTKEYNAIQRKNKQKANSRAIAPTVENARAIIRECNHATKKFAFLCKVPYSTMVEVITIERELLEAFCPFNYGYVNAEGAQKRDEKGKPCLRFDRDALKKCFGTTERFSVGMPWSKFLESLRVLDTAQHNAGNGFEIWYANIKGLQRIGNIDRQSHTRHSDILCEDGTQIECKIETGYMASQYITEFDCWAGIPKR